MSDHIILSLTKRQADVVYSALVNYVEDDHGRQVDRVVSRVFQQLRSRSYSAIEKMAIIQFALKLTTGRKP